MSVESLGRQYIALSRDAIMVRDLPSGSQTPRITYVNDSFTTLFGLRLADVVNDPAFQMMNLGPIRGAIAHNQTDCRLEQRPAAITDKSGGAINATQSDIILKNDANDGHCICTTFRKSEQVSDTTATARPPPPLPLPLPSELSNDRLIAALNAYPSPFVIYDPDDRLVVWNDAYRLSMTDGSEDLTVGLHRTDVARIAIGAGKIINAKGREAEWMSEEHQKQDVAKPVQDIELEGDIHHRLLRSRAENGDLVIVRLDITELVRHRRALERANLEITHLAHHDELTGLGNRRLFKIKLGEMEQRRTEDGGEVAALLIDLDRFKQINDTMGHSAGDHVLIETARRIQDRVSADDLVARVGGDEFVVLMQIQADSPCPVKLANTLLLNLSRPVRYEGQDCFVGASIGLAQTPLMEVDQLLITSDLALYKAKQAGRGQIGIFEPADWPHRTPDILPNG